MLDSIANIIDEYDQLVGVSYVLFDGQRHFITAVELRFISLAFNLRAIADDDTLSINSGALLLESDETLVEAGNSDLWSLCIGGRIAWGWRLTNQQGFDDGLRLEINKPEEKLSTVVEFIVIASGIKIFSAIHHEAI